jgi:hypothetical protein
VVSFTPLPPYPREHSTRYILDRRLWWAPEPVWTLWIRETSLCHAGSLILAVQPIASQYTNCAISAHFQGTATLKIESAGSSETFAIQPTAIRRLHPETRSSPPITHSSERNCVRTVPILWYTSTQHIPRVVYSPILPTVAVEWAALLLRIREFADSSLGPVT